MFVRALVLIIAASCTACSSIGKLCPACGDASATLPLEGNYITFEHPFTDAAADEVSKRAERICGQRKQFAMKTSSTCSLTKCTTHYQCANKPRPAAAAAQQPAK